MKKSYKILSVILSLVLLLGAMPTSVFAAGTKLETPQNLKLQGTMLSWDAVDNADFYGVTLYHPNYVYSIGSWQTDGTNINLYKYLKDGETYGATVIACSNGSYQISNPAEIPLTACTNAGVPIYRDVNVINGTSSASTAYPGMSVRLEAKPAPNGMVFDHWELSGGYINIGYDNTDTVIYVQAICDNDISARATYKYQANVTSAFTIQPQGGAALVGESFNVTYAMNFTPQGAVKVQVEGNTPGSFTDLKQATIDGASIKEDSVATKTFRIVASDGTRNIYSDEFVVSWEDGPRFISQPMGGTVDHNVDFLATYTLNFTPFSCRVERYSDYLYQWVDLSNASATQATISSYDFNTTSKYRIKAIIEGGGEVYSDEFTVTWSDTVSKFIQHPVSGTVGFDEDFTFTFAINFTPASNVAIQKYNSGFDSWDTVGYCTSLTSGTISGYASKTTNKYRLEAYENGTPIHSNEFTVTWEGTDYTVSFAANGGSGTMASVNNVSGEYILPACRFTAPNGQRFKAWLVNGNQKAVGDKINVSANTIVTAIWENTPVTEYMYLYGVGEGQGANDFDYAIAGTQITLHTYEYMGMSPVDGFEFDYWSIRVGTAQSAEVAQMQPGETIIINNDTFIIAMWREIQVEIPNSWQISPTATGIYNITPSKTLSGFSKDNLIVLDKQEKAVKYNDSKKGWPLVKGQSYTVKLNKDFSNTNNLSWNLTKKADTIFTDVSSSQWYNDAVTYSVGRGIISGYGGTTKFGPGDNIQRQDFLVILARLDGVDLTSYGNKKSAFPDVPEGSYYEAAVNWGSEKGIVSGYQNGKFGTGDKITREQLVTFLYRYANYKGLNTSYTTTQKNKVKNTYTDYKNVTDYAQGPVIWAVTNGVIGGKTPTTIVPGGNALRCEVAQIMYNIFKNNIFEK